MQKGLFSLLFAITFPFAFSHAAEVLHVARTSLDPVIDGTTEAAWEGVQETIVQMARIPQELIDTNKQQQQGKYAKNWAKSSYTETVELRIKAMYSDERVFFLAQWQDDTKDDQHKPWVWQGDRETGEYIAGKEREDRLALMFPISGDFDANKLIGKEMVADVWQWKAARSNSAGLIHDKSHRVTKHKPRGKSSMHYTADGEAVYVSRPGDGPAPYKSNMIDPFVHQGDRVAKYITARPAEGDATDVAATGVWADNRWTIEIARKLDTGHKDNDATFVPSQDTLMAAAVFNHAGDHFHAVSDVLQVVFEQ